MTFTQLRLYGKSFERQVNEFVHRDKLPIVLVNGYPLTYDQHFTIEDGILSLKGELSEADTVTLVDRKTGNVATFLPSSLSPLSEEPREEIVEPDPEPEPEPTPEPEPEVTDDEEGDADGTTDDDGGDTEEAGDSEEEDLQPGT